MCSMGWVGPDAGVAAADAALTRALTGGVEHPGHDESAALLVRLRSLIAKADALTLAIVGKVDADGSYTVAGAVTAAGWVRAACHATAGEAARTVRCARTLRSGVLPNTAAALAAGRSPAGTPR
jgi:lactam utilization protein B